LGKIQLNQKIQAQTMSEIFIRIYAECDTADEAINLQNQIAAALNQYKPSFLGKPYKYWKIPEYFGFEITIPTTADEIFQSIIALANENWTHGEDQVNRSSVWNWHDNCHFLIPQARWAEVQIIY